MTNSEGWGWLGNSPDTWNVYMWELKKQRKIQGFGIFSIIIICRTPIFRFRLCWFSPTQNILELGNFTTCIERSSMTTNHFSSFVTEGVTFSRNGRTTTRQSLFFTSKISTEVSRQHFGFHIVVSVCEFSWKHNLLRFNQPPWNEIKMAVQCF